jgi:hypothetical protein
LHTVCIPHDWWDPMEPKSPPGTRNSTRGNVCLPIQLTRVGKNPTLAELVVPNRTQRDGSRGSGSPLTRAFAGSKLHARPTSLTCSACLTRLGPLAHVSGTIPHSAMASPLHLLLLRWYKLDCTCIYHTERFQR